MINLVKIVNFFSIVNLMLGCLLFKKSKKFNEFCFLLKAARMSPTYLN